MKREIFKFLPAVAALCAAQPSFAAESPQQFASLSPAERAHALKMVEYRKARDVAEREVLRIKGEIEARRAAILETNEEAKTLFAEAEALFAEYSAKTNALQAILEGDERMSSLFSEIRPAQAIVESRQSAMNAEVVAAMRERMQRQREAAEAEAAAAAAAGENDAASSAPSTASSASNAQ